ncbi:MAG: PspC domain-containing protein [Herpetosiphon sp.]
MTRLIRPRTERMIGGVCGGLGHYWGIDPVIVRLVFVVLALTNGIGLIAYLILWFIMPDDHTYSALPPDARFDPQTGLPLPHVAAPPSDVHTPAPLRRHYTLALVLLAIGALVLLNNVGEIMHIDVGNIGLPILLIGFGVYLLRRHRTP